MVGDNVRKSKSDNGCDAMNLLFAVERRTPFLSTFHIHVKGYRIEATKKC